MTRNEYIASIMLEAADLLNESSGRNGYGERRYLAKAKEVEEYDPETADKYRQKAAKMKDDKKSKFIVRDYDGKGGTYVSSERGKKAAQDSRRILDRDMTIGRGRIAPHTYAGIRANKNINDRARKKGLDPDGRALKEAIDIFYDYAANCDTLDEAVEYINKAEELEKVLYEDYE